MSEPRKSSLLQVPVREPLDAAVRLGAQVNFTSVSDYVRRAIITQLRADGIDPLHPRPASAAASAAPAAAEHARV